MKKIYLFYLCTLLAICGASAQSRSGSLSDAEGKYKYNYVPVSPSAEELMKKITSPVNYNTGRVDASIPLYEIKTRDFTLPLVLRYNSGGIKVSATNDIAGLGWTLDFGPSVSRSIQGSPDEEGYLYYNPNYGSDDRSYLHKIVDGDAHEQPDVFYYNTFDAQGCFIFDRPKNSGESGSYRPVYFPLTVDKVEASDIRNSGFQITDGSGNLYKFQESEYTNTNLLTGWKLSEVVSPRNDKLSFSYIANRITHRNYYDYYAVEDMDENAGPDFQSYRQKSAWKGVDGKIQGALLEETVDAVRDTLWGSFPFGGETGMTYDNYPGSTVDAKYPKEIVYTNGKVTFTYNGILLTDMYVYEKGTGIQHIALTYKNMTVGGRALLKKVVFNDLVSGQSRSYDMEYYNESSEYSPTTKAVDRFGYYNGNTENTDLVERQVVQMRSPNDYGFYPTCVYIGGADRSPAMWAATQYTLSNLHYPTGASEHFVYELNTYPGYNEQGNQAEIYAGGLRIQLIEYKDASARLKNKRQFSYDQGYAPQVTFQNEYTKLYSTLGTRTASRYRLYSSLTVADAGTAAGISVLYPYVAVTEIDENTNWVTYENYEYNKNFYFPGIYKGMVHDEVNHYKKGQLLKKTDTDNEAYDVVRTEEYGYTTLSTKNTPVVQAREVQRDDMTVDDGLGIDLDGYRQYRQYNYSIGFGNQHPVLQEKVTKDYYGGKAVTNTVTNTFGTTDMDARTGLPVKETHTFSDGNKKVVSYSYPYHVAGNSAMQAMVEANDLMKPVSIKETTTDATGSTQSSRIDRDYVTRSGIGSALLQQVRITGYNGSSKTMESYPRHDGYGNVCEIQRPDSPVTTILWGYDYSLPVAIVEGAVYNDVINRLGISYESLQSLDGSSLESRLLALRSSFPDPCKVTVYRHAPKRGIVYQNAPNGKVTTYSYDGMGRLTETRDQEGAVLQYNEYKK